MSLLLWHGGNRREVLKAIAPAVKADPELPLQWYEGSGPMPQSKVVLAMGAGTLTAMRDMGAMPKNVSLTAARGRLWKHPGTPAPLLFTYSDSIKSVDHGQYIGMLTDVGLALRVARTGQLAPQLGNYRYVQRFDDAADAIRKHYIATGEPLAYAFDTETVGTDYVHPDRYLVSIQVSYAKGQADVIRFGSREEMEDAFRDPDFLAPLVFILTSPMARGVGTNGKYESLWLAFKTQLEWLNFTFDTVLVGSLLDENRNNDLGTHTKLYVPALGGYSDEFDRTVDKSRMDLVPPDRLLPYAGCDVDAARQVYVRQRADLLAQPGLARFYINLLHPAARAYEQVERAGVLVDREAYRELEADLKNTIADCVQQAKKLVGGLLVARHTDAKRPGYFNLTKASFINDFMFSPRGLNLKPLDFTAKATDKAGNRLPATSLEHLLKFRKVPEAKAFVDVMKEYSSASKMLSTYVATRDPDGVIQKGFLLHLREDGRFHPSYFLHRGNKDDDEGGTITGRLSAKDPAFQCMVGETMVLTSSGLRRLDWLVEHHGAGLRVLTHTGKWQPIVGVYRNGVQPVFKVILRGGRSVVCTGNHPLLTSRGWVRTDQLVAGGRCYATKDARTPCSAEYQPNIPLVGSHEESMLFPNVHGASLDEGDPADGSSFQEERILSIEPAGYRETFDLTIEGSHSFVANGIVVHNTIPKHNKWAKAIRRCFIAPPGMVIMSRDYSQGELRIHACLANEANMIEAYRKGMDLHALTAGTFRGFDYPAMMKLKEDDPDLYDEIRQLGKAGNFGLLYLMGVDGFIEYAYGNYGVDLSDEEGAKFRDGFFERYPSLEPYANRTKEMARQLKQVRSPLGRIRHLPLIDSSFRDVRAKEERRAVNSPTQATLSDLSLLATAVEYKRGWHRTRPVFGMVHDQLLSYVPEDKAVEYAQEGKDLMENLPLYKMFGWKPQLVFVADATLGYNLADQVKLEKLMKGEPLKKAA